MSAEAKPSVVECHGPECKRAGPTWQFHHGVFCSDECEARAKGRQALSDLRSSHAHCFTCFAQLKDIEDPKPDWEFTEKGVELTYNAEDDYLEWVQYRQEHTRKAACGYQDLRPEADIGSKTVAQGRKTISAAVCGECGNTQHYQHIAMIADGHRTAALTAAYLNDEDEHEFDTELLHRRYVATGDIELATGEAILIT